MIFSNFPTHELDLPLGGGVPPHFFDGWGAAPFIFSEYPIFLSLWNAQFYQFLTDRERELEGVSFSLELVIIA